MVPAIEPVVTCAKMGVVAKINAHTTSARPNTLQRRTNIQASWILSCLGVGTADRFAMRYLSTLFDARQAGPRENFAGRARFGNPDGFAGKPNRWSPLRKASEALQERVVRRKLLKPLQQHLHRVHR